MYFKHKDKDWERIFPFWFYDYEEKKQHFDWWSV